MFLCDIFYLAFNQWLAIIFNDILLVAYDDSFLGTCVSPESNPSNLLKMCISYLLSGCWGIKILLLTTAPALQLTILAFESGVWCGVRHGLEV